MLTYDAWGTIVVCLTAFLLGAAVTLFCIRIKKRTDRKEKRDGR